MPILQNAKKALRVSKRKTLVNQRVKSKMKTAIDAMKQTPTQENLNKAFEAIDMAGKKIIHHNKAARLKSQLSKLLTVVGEAAPKATAKVVKTTKKVAKAVSKKTA
jgi:ribosomal protein S20